MSFSQTLQSLVPHESGYRVTVGEDWSQGRACFGGLIAAVGNEAMRKLVPADRPLRSLQTTFVGPASPGTWQISVRVLRIGKAVTLAQCNVLDAGQVAATMVGVYGLARESAVAVRPAAVKAAREMNDAHEVRYQPGITPAFIQHFALRWVEGAKPFSGSPQTPTKAFIRHQDPSRLTESHVIALVDCIPTPAMSMFTTPAPASSLVWTLDFFEHRFDFAADAWWRIDTDIDAAADGYVNQTGLLNNPDGVPVALSRQLFAVFG